MAFRAPVRETCMNCQKVVYPTEKMSIDGKVLHKTCFTCKHCSRQLTMSGFAAVNGQLYCKPHYFELFAKSGGRYDAAFGAYGSEKSDKPSAAALPEKSPNVSAVLTEPSEIDASSADISKIEEAEEGKPVSLNVSAVSLKNENDSMLSEKSDLEKSSSGRVKSLRDSWQKKTSEDANTSTQSIKSANDSSILSDSAGKVQQMKEAFQKRPPSESSKSDESLDKAKTLSSQGSVSKMKDIFNKKPSTENQEKGVDQPVAQASGVKAKTNFLEKTLSIGALAPQAGGSFKGQQSSSTSQEAVSRDVGVFACAGAAAAVEASGGVLDDFFSTNLGRSLSSTSPNSSGGGRGLFAELVLEKG